MFDRQIDVGHQYDIHREGAQETPNSFVAAKMPNAWRWFLLESAFGRRHAADHLIGVGSIILNNFFQSLRMRSPAYHQNSLPQFSGNRLLEQKSVKQTA